ncbi:GNAT family N-acetyltransferase [Aegicerativicinus sediminis]|uniref:GNAT family N-acetyltransferase n=1 Tax=Aegicerativicinus sediminis TaxID=2893202 RepID=UPI001E617DD7|nr:GNAT family protein [Aegicerativicinus sediminis]
MNIQFRRLLPHESSLYRTIRLECLKQYPENFGSNYQDEIKKKKLFFEDHLENENPDNFVIGGFYNDRLIAISGFNRYDSLKTKHRGRIIQVYVTPEFQGHNIGFNLVKATVEEAFNNEEIEQIEIDVLVNNTKAESIYSKIGFKTYGIQEKYLKIGEMYFNHRMMYIFADNYHSS